VLFYLQEQQNGFIEMETTTLSIDTTFAKIIRLTLAAASRSDTEIHSAFL
jgi:Cd2+/Zn2+-exporting ATPase